MCRYGTPPLRKRPERIGIGLKCMLFIAQFFKANSLKKKIRSITIILWVLGSFQICSFSHKKVMGYFRFFFTHSGLFTALYPTLCVKKKLQKILQITIYEKSKNFTVIVSQMRVFRSVALVIKKLWAILDFFFTHSRLFTALYPTLCVKKKTKNILQITIYEKSKNFTVIVS